MSQSLLQSISLCMDSSSHPTCETETRRSQNGSSQSSVPLWKQRVHFSRWKRERDEGNFNFGLECLSLVSTLNATGCWAWDRKDLKGNHFARWAGQRQSPVSLQLHLITRRLLDYMYISVPPKYYLIHHTSSFLFLF